MTNNLQNYLDLQSGQYPVLLGVLFTNKLTTINENVINIQFFLPSSYPSFVLHPQIQRKIEVLLG